MLAVSQSVTSVFFCALGSSPGIGFFLHVRFTGCCSSSPPYSVSYRFFAVFTFYMCISMPFMMLSLTLNSSYLMVSSVVGFYSSPFFTGILPRAKDTNLTQVYDRYRSHAAYFVSFLRIRAWMSSSVWFQIIANCMSLLILSSALPVFSRTIGKSCKNTVLFKQYSRLIIFIE